MLDWSTRTRACAGVVATMATVGCAGTGGAGPAIHRAAATGQHRRTMLGLAPRAPAATRVLIGHSRRGQPIVAQRSGEARAPTAVLVVGCVHGDERAGIAVVKRLQREPPIAGVALWSIAELNPDGAAARTRQNADRVDLNRNFPYRWRPLGRPGDRQYSGPRTLSEPEARAAVRLIRRIHPTVTVWFHQPLGLVDESGGNIAVERRFAHLIRLPLRRLTRYPGSAAGWQNAAMPSTTAFVVELPPGQPRPDRVRRAADAVRTLARSLR